MALQEAHDHRRQHHAGAEDSHVAPVAGSAGAGLRPAPAYVRRIAVKMRRMIRVLLAALFALVARRRLWRSGQGGQALVLYRAALLGVRTAPRGREPGFLQPHASHLLPE